MRLRWQPKALSDLERLRAFLDPVNPKAAGKAVLSLVLASAKLLEQPRRGARLEEFNPRDVRRVLVGDYEMRCEIAGDVVYVLRLWHSREDR